MKKKFSTKWIGSRQRRKQRKFRINAPLHIRHRFMSANLSKELRDKYNRRSFELRKGDKIKVMRGKFKKQEGKITLIDLKKTKVIVEGVQIQKKDGTKVNVPLEPSNLQILELNIEDKERMFSINKNKDSNAKK